MPSSNREDAPTLSDLDPSEVESYEDLVGYLKRLRAIAGKPSFRYLESEATRRGLGALPRSGISRILQGKGEITKKTKVLTFVRLCGVPQSHLLAWQQAWERAADRYETRQYQGSRHQAQPVSQQSLPLDDVASTSQTSNTSSHVAPEPASDGKVERLRRIRLGIEPYGVGEPIEQAIQFYSDELLDDIAKRIPQPPFGDAELLITQPDPACFDTMLICRVLAPKRVLLVSPESRTEQTGRTVDRLVNYLVTSGIVRLADCQHYSFPPEDPASLYRIIESAHRRETFPDADQRQLYVDLTHGTGALATAAGIAAEPRNLKLFHLDVDFDAHGQTLIGSERLVFLDNLAVIFKEQEMAKVRQTFASGAYELACRQYGHLCDTLAEPAAARFMYEISSLYRAWCDWDFHALPKVIATTESALAGCHPLAEESVRRVQNQLALLRRLATGDEASVLLSFVILADHYREIYRHDMAVVLYLRAIESVLFGRLRRLAPEFSVYEPNYAELTDDIETLKARYNNILQSVYAGLRNRDLPSPIGLMDSAVLLFALEDPMLKRAELSEIKGLAHLNSLLGLRNRSALGHGINQISAHDSYAVHARTLIILQAYWKTLGNNDNARTACKELRLLRTDR